MKKTGERLYLSSITFLRAAALGFRTAWQTTGLPAIVSGGALLLAFVLFLGFVQFSTPNLPDNDGFYHIKMAEIMRLEGLKPDFPWLPLTILNAREFYNHHFLFHVALIPFTLGDLRLGAKFAAVIFAVLAFLMVWWLLKLQRVPYAFLWGLGLLAVSEAFIYRMSITRALSLSLLLLALGLHWLLTGRHVRLIFLGFLFVWAYNGFPLIIALAGIYIIAVWLVERRLDVRPGLFAVLGVTAGLIINPYFPHNLVFIIQHILPKLLEATSISVGNEWFPYTTAQLLTNSPLALLAFISGALALGLSHQRMTVRTAASLLTACLFGLMLFQSRRFIEYFPPFALVFAAFAWSPLIQRALDQVRKSEGRFSVERMRLGLWLALALVVLFAGARMTFNDARSSIQNAKPYSLFAGAAAWLEDNTPPGSRVFQTDWDDFPRLFFYNTHNTYLVGLDPTYMQLYDAELYDRWVAITRGQVDNPSEAILNEFGARYVVSDLHHRSFLAKADRDPRLVKVYSGADSVIFEIVE
ncbi:MAG TPA: hypothetical protein VLH85_01490 [Levilinea sp.]|nr:hypothetical protein [Levilinea sp.]